MPISFKYWDDRLDPEDMRLMWPDPQVSIEWINAREMRGQKVHLSQDPDGEVYLTQTEMMREAFLFKTPIYSGIEAPLSQRCHLHPSYKWSCVGDKQ